MPGYEFRRKITFDKTKIEGGVTSSLPKQDLDVPDFPVLIELQDEAFKYRTDAPCGNAADLEGRTIAFATTAAPAVKLSFQIESYDPLEGRYRCWVRIPILAAAGTNTPATSLYFYYGSSAVHDNYSALALGTWDSGYRGVWHMNAESSDLGSLNAKTGLPSESLTGHGLTGLNQHTGKIGNAVRFDDPAQYLSGPGDTSTTFTVSAWIKWNGGTSSQMIADTDSTGPGKSGWQLRINAQGKIEAAAYRSAGAFWATTSTRAVMPDVWTHVAFSYTIIASNSSKLAIFINGSSAGGLSGASLRFRPGGYLSVGRNKDGGQSFKGLIDELRIYSVSMPEYWLANEYHNQNDPASFYSIGTEEASAGWTIFTGAEDADWSAAGNWLNLVRPVAGSKVRILAGKTARITGTDVVLSQLVLEDRATLSSAASLRLNCTASFGAGAVLNLDAERKLILAGDGLSLLGTGMVNTSILEIDMANSSSIAELQTDVKITKELGLVKGKLKTNGKLWLLASRSAAAAFAPVTNLANASVLGDVNVQCFVDGSFPEPSSGRGWRLWSAPVVGSDGGYNLLGIKNSVFVTGQGGVANGFDASPNNGATIYTHDQSLTGALKEKYTPVSNLDFTCPIGRGFYLFSRGSRLSENAYQNQIQIQPFINPAPYLVTYKGALFAGDLKVDVFSRNLGEEGDGYNLLGNPYASAIRWGSLVKENVGPFIWMFDPLNGTYRVSNDPDTYIPSGTGFFVKVLDGFTIGSVTFTEGCKIRE